MNSPGLQQGAYRGLWFEEDVQLLDLYAEWRPHSRCLLISIQLTAYDLSLDMRQVIDSNWHRVTHARARRERARRTFPVDNLPWEIHDIDDPEIRQIAAEAYMHNRI